MKIFCDYCGNQFETEGNSTCPSCGASYDGDIEIKNAAIKKAREDEMKRRQENMELSERQAKLESMKTLSKNTKAGIKLVGIGCLLPVIAGVLCFIVIFTIAVIQVAQERTVEREQESSSLLEDYEYESVFVEDESPVSADFNEYAETVNYSVICDSFEKVDRYPFSPTDGYMYVSFHLIVKNTGIGEVNTTNNIICLADGMITQGTWHSDRKEMPDTTLPAGVSAEGWMCFEVPTDTKEFELRYGDIVTIYIENTIEKEQ